MDHKKLQPMYKVIRFSLFILFFAITSVKGQQSEIPVAAMDAMFAKFKKIQADALAKKQYEKDLEQLVDNMMKNLNEWIKKKKLEQEIIAKNYKPGYNHTPGEMNLFPIWEEIPGPVPSLKEAKQTNFELKYETYIDKITGLKKDMSDMVKQHLSQQRDDQQTVMNDTKTMANKNGIVQQMGGADEVMKMSKAERKQAAINASASVKTNTAAYSGVRNEGMNAMMQRMMNDPAYREKYNKMSNAEKQAELKKYMGNQMAERNDEAFEQTLKDRNNVYNAMNIDQVISQCLQKMQEGAKPYAEGTQLANTFFDEAYNNIEAWYKKQYDALPLSKTREKMGLAELIKCKQTMVYEFHEKEAATRTILWNLLKSNLKIAFGEFNDLVGGYPWGKAKNMSLVDGTYTEPRVAKAVISLYDDMIRLTKDAELLTRSHKGRQEQHELIMK